MIPKRNRWRKWSLPTKVGYVSSIFGILGFIIGALSSITMGFEKYIERFTLNSLSIREVKYDYTFSTDTYNGFERDIQKIFYLKIKYPFFKKDFLEYINNELKNNVLDSINESLVMYNSDYEIGIVSARLLSIKMTQYTFHYPALNGNNSVWAINIDPLNHTDFDFFDVFDAKRNALEEIKKIIKNKSECDFFDNFNKASFIPRFFIKNDGIEFIFSEYEVTPGMCGNVIVKIEYDELVNYLRHDGPLGVLISPSRSWNADYHWYKAISNAINSK